MGVIKFVHIFLGDAQVKGSEIKEDEQNQTDIEKEDIEPEPDTTLYIKNINFDTDEDGIKKVTLITFYSYGITVFGYLIKP